MQGKLVFLLVLAWVLVLLVLVLLVLELEQLLVLLEQLLVLLVLALEWVVVLKGWTYPRVPEASSGVRRNDRTSFLRLASQLSRYLQADQHAPEDRHADGAEHEQVVASEHVGHSRADYLRRHVYHPTSSQASAELRWSAASASEFEIRW